MSKIVRWKKRGAFTVTELLVSVAIIGVLMAALLPLMKKAMESARKTKCASNLQQIGTAMNLFASDNNETYPVAYSDSGSNASADTPTWIWQLKPYLGMAENSMGMAPLPRAAGVFLCPALKPVTTRDVSYALNTYMTYSSGRQWRYKRLIIPQATTILVAEISSNGDIASPFSGNIVRRHPGPSANYLFADGHVENIPELIPYTDKRWEPDLR